MSFKVGGFHNRHLVTRKGDRPPRYGPSLRVAQYRDLYPAYPQARDTLVDVDELVRLPDAHIDGGEDLVLGFGIPVRGSYYMSMLVTFGIVFRYQVRYIA